VSNGQRIIDGLQEAVATAKGGRPMLREACDALGGLYTKTGFDWELVIRHTLTEPTCPMAIVRVEQWPGHSPRPEEADLPEFGRIADTIEEAALAALAAAKEWLDGR